MRSAVRLWLFLSGVLVVLSETGLDAVGHVRDSAGTFDAVPIPPRTGFSLTAAGTRRYDCRRLAALSSPSLHSLQRRDKRV